MGKTETAEMGEKAGREEMRGRLPRKEDYTVFESRPGQPRTLAKEEDRERDGYFHRLLVGDRVDVEPSVMGGEKPRPGERCFTEKMFVCMSVKTVADFALSVMEMQEYPKEFSRWKRLFVRAALLFAYGPRHYKTVKYYKLKFVGKEKNDEP